LLLTIHMKGNMQDECRKTGQVHCTLGMPWDTSRRWERMRKGSAIGVGYYLGARTVTALV
jgi:hypothetical protein